MKDYHKFLHILFEPEEFICPCSRRNESGRPIENRTLRRSDFRFTEDTNWISANPFLPHTTRAIDNVSSFRNIVLEFDEGDISDQMNIIKEKGFPYSTLVFSGHKSLHCIIALDEDVGLSKYKEYCRKLKQVIPEIDEKCLEPSTFTRLPGAIRSGRVQDLISLKEKVPHSTFLTWLNKHPEPPKPPNKHHIKNPEGLKELTKKFLKYGIRSGGSVSRHDKLKMMAIDLFKNGLDFHTAHLLLVPAYTSHNLDKTEEEVYRMLDWVYNNFEK